MRRALALAVLAGCCAGCTYVGLGMDWSGSRLARQAEDYCRTPGYRRQALRLLVNGRLAQSAIAVHIDCPGDALETRREP